MTRDMRHVTWWEVNILSKFQLCSSYGLGVMMFCRFGGKGQVTELINYEGVCGTAPATPGLLITLKNRYKIVGQVVLCTRESFNFNTLIIIVKKFDVLVFEL